MRRSFLRVLAAAALLTPLGGCQTAGLALAKPKPCADCANGVCERHNASTPDPDAITTPGESPFTPFPVGG
jgi:hypothetical protein